MKRTIKWVALLSPLFFIGCYIPIPASPARTSQMTITTPATPNQLGTMPLRDSINVKDVSGGKKTNPIFTHSNIGNDEFRGALESSLKLAGLLERTNGEGKYYLSAQILDVDHPIVGGSLTVTTHILYFLSDISSGKEIFHELISAKYTATISDSIHAVVRLQLANEGAARVNIAKLIEKLFQLGISQGDVSVPH